MNFKRRSSLVIGILAVLLVLYSTGVYACTDIVVGKNASVDGSVITSHTVDGQYDSRLQIIPAQDWAAGSMTPVWENIVNGDLKPLKKLGEIPQVSHTYQYVYAAYPFMNEHQLIIGETTLGGRRETANSEAAIMTIEQLQAYALQRCTTAREAIKLMGELAEKYGYRESCYLGECLTVTDPNEAWVFEIFGVGPLWTPESGKPGAVWAAQRVPDDHITCVPNMSRIREIDPNSPDFMVSKNYIETAVDLGLYDPNSGKPFIWNEVYGDAKNVSMGCWLRVWRVYSVLAPSVKWNPYDAPNYPFSIKPEKKVSFQDVIALFRDTYQGTQFDMTEDPDWYYRTNDGFKKSPLATPQVDATWRALLDIEYYRPIARYNCSYFFVSQARSWLPDDVGGVAWVGMDNPESSLFVPLYAGATAVPESWKRNDRSKLDWKSAWWAFGLVDDLVNQRYGTMMPKLQAARDPLQNRFFEQQAVIEKTAAELYNSDPAAARQFITNYTKSCMEEGEQLYWSLVEQFLFDLNNN